MREWKTIETDSKGKARMDDVTICTSFIRQDYILDCLRSIYQYVKSVSFKIVSVNQTQPNREFEEELYSLSDVVIRPHVNWGFSQSMNIAMRTAPTSLICALNDDVLFINDPFPGIAETFSRFENAAAVCPQSVKEPGWGWAEPGYRYLIPQKYMAGELKKLHERDRELMLKVKEAEAAWSKFQQCSVRDAETGKQLLARLQGRRRQFRETQQELEERVLKLSYNRGYTDALIKEKKWAVVDGFAMYAPVWKTGALSEIGLFDERWFPGGGEDYDYLARASQAGFRMLSTSRSLLWHKWGASKDAPDGFSTALPPARRHWNKISTKSDSESGVWHPECDVWGHNCSRVDPEIYRAPL